MLYYIILYTQHVSLKCNLPEWIDHRSIQVPGDVSPLHRPKGGKNGSQNPRHMGELLLGGCGRVMHTKWWMLISGFWMLLDGCCLCLLAPFCWRRPIRPRGIHAFLYEIARCLLSKQAKSAGPQRTTLPCFLAGTKPSFHRWAVVNNPNMFFPSKAWNILDEEHVPNQKHPQ